LAAVGLNQLQEELPMRGSLGTLKIGVWFLAIAVLAIVLWVSTQPVAARMIWGG